MRLEPSLDADACCPNCGSLIWLDPNLPNELSSEEAKSRERKRCAKPTWWHGFETSSGACEANIEASERKRSRRRKRRRRLG